MERPGLAGLLRRSDAVGGRGERLVDAVHYGQHPAAEVTGETFARVLAGVDAGVQGGVDEGQRRFEVVAGVVEIAFGQLQGETGDAIAGDFDGLPYLVEELLRLITADGDHQVVEQLSEEAGPQVRRQPCQGERPATRLGAHLGRYREEAGDAETNLGLLLRRERLA